MVKLHKKYHKGGEMAQEFEDKLKVAKELLDKMNDPEITLSESMDIYKKGVKTLGEASKMLEDAKLIFDEEVEA